MGHSESPFPRRKHPRWGNHNYTSSGAYFVTICVHGRRCVLGRVVDDAVRLSLAGALVRDAWIELASRFPSVRIDRSVVMPNHVHGILVLRDDPMGDGAREHSLSQVVGAFKSDTTVRYGRGVRAGVLPPYRVRLWQRGFHDRVIRDERELANAREYIDDNPRRWARDRLNPDRHRAR